jgi:hypothetical protein
VFGTYVHGRRSTKEPGTDIILKSKEAPGSSENKKEGLFPPSPSRLCELHPNLPAGAVPGAAFPPLSGNPLRWPSARERRGAGPRTQAVGRAPAAGDAHGLVSALMRRLAARGAAGDAEEAAAPASEDSSDCVQCRSPSPRR